MFALVIFRTYSRFSWLLLNVRCSWYYNIIFTKWFFLKYRCVLLFLVPKNFSKKCSWF